MLKTLRYSAREPHRIDGRPITRMWERVHSLFACIIRNRLPLPSRFTVVALVVDHQDRGVLANAFEQEPLDVHFANSCEEAFSVANQLVAPVVLLDRDWPGTEWKTAVQKLASSPNPACVILVSNAADVYLWQELIRRGGFDVLSKPLRADKVERVVRLAISYWISTPKPAVPAGSLET